MATDTGKVIQVIKNAWPLLTNAPPAAAKKVYPLSSRHTHRDLLSLSAMFAKELRRSSQDIGIEPTAKSPITRDHKQFGLLTGMPVQQRMGGPIRS